MSEIAAACFQERVFDEHDMCEYLLSAVRFIAVHNGQSFLSTMLCACGFVSSVPPV